MVNALHHVTPGLGGGRAEYMWNRRHIVGKRLVCKDIG